MDMEIGRDYEYTFVILQPEARQMLERGEEFVDTITRWLDALP